MTEAEASKDTYTGKLDLKAAFTGTLPEDPNLLDELGIDIQSIKYECLLPINVLKNQVEAGKRSNDITGPILILFAFTFSLILQGKIHFGYIYLISLISSFLVFTLLSLMSHKGISYLACCNVMGYSLTPVIFFSFLNLLLAWTGLKFRILLACFSSVWSAYTSSKVFCIYLDFVDRQIIVLYPLFLAYTCFVMMVLF